MRQIWITRAGGPEVLEVREAPDPAPRAGEVRICVHASGMNFADISARIGLYPDMPKTPCVVGYEVAGVVDAVGAGVTSVAVGTRVMALTHFGGHADTVVTRAKLVWPIPGGLAYTEAAAIPVVYATAWLMLVRLGNVQSGERVLVHAAAGGVGQAALQICRWKGARVIGTASASKHARLLAAGVEHCIDYTKDDFEVAVKRLTGGRGVDIVLDAVGGKSFAKSYRSLAPLGRLFCFGGSAFQPEGRRNLGVLLKTYLELPRFKPFDLMDANRGVFGVNLGHLWEMEDALQGILGEISAKVADGTFAPTVDKVFRFDEVRAAHLYMQERRNFGKVVLVP